MAAPSVHSSASAPALQDQLTRPMTVGKINTVGASHTRRSFLDPFFQPLVDEDCLTVADVMSGLQDAIAKLNKYDIFDPIETATLSKSTSPTAAQTDVDIAMVLREKSRVYFKTGTELGNAEGSASAEGHARNIFGGGESLHVHASAGTRTRSAYATEFQTPIIPGDPDTRVALNALATATAKPWSSYEEIVKAAGGKVNWGPGHQMAYAMNWRTLTGLAGAASPTVRHDAGDSVKNSLTYTFLRDKRDNPMLPQRGYIWKTVCEVAGWGPLGGDVSFGKGEIEVGRAVPIPIPGVKGNSGISIGGAFRCGLMYPLSLGYSLAGKAQPSRINDRFQLGGPNDVRGFKQGGLGPRDGPDATGGDVFAAGSVNLLLPLPRIGADSNFRIQLFANGGRLVALKNRGKKNAGTKGKGMGQALTASDVRGGMVTAMQDLCTGLPSLVVGVGLVYAHPVARFELNFSLPLVLRAGEEGRKGLQVGVGINFL